MTRLPCTVALSCLFAACALVDLQATEVPFDRFYPQEAVLVPLSERSQIQARLDQHGVIRLQPGDYMPNNSLRNITIRSNQRIYGLGSVIPDLTVEPGSQDIVVSFVHGKIIFPGSSQVTRRALFRRVSYSNYQAVGATIEDCVFLSPATSFFNIDNRSSGWWRNNRFLRYLSHGGNPAFQMRGDTNRNSYGNVMLWANSLTPPEEMFVFENLADFNLIHLDVEGYSTAGKPAIQLGAMGAMTVYSTTGHIPTGRTVDAYADALWLHGHTMGNSQPPSVNLRSSNQVSLVVNGNTTQPLQDDAPGNIRAIGYVNGGGTTKTLTVNGVANPAAGAVNSDTRLALATLVSSARTGQQWERPTFVMPPDPVVANPATQPSSTDAIQAQIDAQGVVLLPEGTYYLDRPLVFRRGSGLVGAGMNKTILVARNQDTDLIVNGTTAGLTLADLTLKGGRNGIRLRRNGNEQLQYNEINLSHVTIRDMRDHGLVFEEIYGFDNNFVDYVNFVNCGTAFRQIATQKANLQDPGLTYMDKCMFYQCQFIGCNKALDLLAARASGGNMWVNCLFKDNRDYAVRGVHHSPLTLANCDLINNGGHPVVNTDGALSLIACVFKAGIANPTDLVDAINVSVEGCHFDADGATTTKITAEPPNWISVNYGNPDDANTKSYFTRNVIYYNSSSNLPIGDLRQGLLFNTTFTQNLQYSTRGAYVVNGTPTVIIPGAPVTSPTSQLLVGSQLPPAMTSETGSTPDLTSPNTVLNATASNAFSYAITALHFPTEYSATGLPAWLSLNLTTGIITGVPPAAGSFGFTITASNVFGTDSQDVTLTVAAATANAPLISGSLTITAYLDTPFTYQVVATNSPTSYNAAALPSGLGINTITGLISGAPTQIDTRIASITATNPNGIAITSMTFRVLPKLLTPIVPPGATPPSTTPSTSPSSAGGGSGCGLGASSAGLLLGMMLFRLRRQRQLP